MAWICLVHDGWQKWGENESDSKADSHALAFFNYYYFLSQHWGTTLQICIHHSLSLNSPTWYSPQGALCWEGELFVSARPDVTGWWCFWGCSRRGDDWQRLSHSVAKAPVCNTPVHSSSFLPLTLDASIHLFPNRKKTKNSSCFPSSPFYLFLLFFPAVAANSPCNITHWSGVMVRLLQVNTLWTLPSPLYLPFPSLWSPCSGMRWPHWLPALTPRRGVSPIREAEGGVANKEMAMAWAAHGSSSLAPGAQKEEPDALQFTQQQALVSDDTGRENLFPAWRQLSRCKKIVCAVYLTRNYHSPRNYHV